MIQSYKFEGKTEEESLEKCLEELRLEKQNLYIKTSLIEGKLFKSKKVITEVIIKKDVIEYIKKYLKDLSLLTNISMNIEVRENNDVINVVLVSEQNPILIGKEGRTLDSIQTLLRQTLKKIVGINLKLNVDASNYKMNKQKYFEQNIRKIAKEVITSRIDSKLDPMNSYDRRLVHTIIDEFKELTTISEGEEPARYVIIKYKEI